MDLSLVFAVLVLAACPAANGKDVLSPKDPKLIDKRQVDILGLNVPMGAVEQPYQIVEVIPVARTPTQPQPSWKVSATLSSEDMAVQGTIAFKQLQPDLPTMVAFNLTGLAAGKHAVHVHSFGDITDGCKSTGPHFLNSFINNIEPKEDGSVTVEYPTYGINLYSGIIGLIGRSVVVHEKPYQMHKYPYVSNPLTFQSAEDTVGAVIACGVVTITNNIQ